MTDEEVEVVAQELAKAGGTSWYPRREAGTMLRVVTERYRDQARAIIMAFDHLRAKKGGGQSAMVSRHPAASYPTDAAGAKAGSHGPLRAG